MNMQKLLQQAKKMEKEIRENQEKLMNKSFEASNSLVSIKMNGAYQVLEFNIKEMVDPEDKDMLEDAVVAVINEVTKNIEKELEKDQSKYKSLMPGMF